MNWIELSSVDQLNEIDNLSKQNSVVIFKHSTRCSISIMALQRFERKWEGNSPTYFLDLLNHRDISGLIADRYQIQHQSPQALIIKDGKCIFSSTHSEIDALEIKGKA